MDLIKLGGYILIIVPTLIVGVVLGFYLIQDYMIFLGDRLPSDHQYTFKEEFEEHFFITPSGHKLNVLHFKAKESKGLVYYHHGNSGNLQGWGNYAKDFLKNNYDVVFYDYRGYGKSTGRISKQHQIHDDALLILKQIKRLIKPEKIIYFGNSLGTGIATKLALDEEPSALILEMPYFNFCELINVHYPYLPAKIMSKYRIRTNKYIGDINCPILILHGTHDEIVPYNHGLRLSKLNKNCKFVGIINGVHSNLPDFRQYQKELGAFMQGH